MGTDSSKGSEVVTCTTILQLKLIPLVPSTCDHDEICSACYNRGQHEVVVGEMLLACSFCNEAWHDKAECIGSLHPAPADEEEWACPNCIAEATKKLSRRAQGRRK